MLHDVSWFSLPVLFPMICSTWNCRRAVSPIFIRHVRDLSRLYSVSLLGVLEFWISSNRAKEVVSKVGF